MSIEDAKNRIKQNQEQIEQERERKEQAQRDQAEIEEELSREISRAVNDAIYVQDTNIRLLTKELNKTNTNYQLLHRDIVALSDLLKDSSALQEAYDIKRREMEEHYKEEEAALKKKLDAQKHTHDALLKAEQLEYNKKKQEWAQLKLDLNAELRTEELNLRRSIASIKNKKMAIIIGIIAVFVVAFLLGLMIASNGLVSTSQVPY